MKKAITVLVCIAYVLWPIDVVPDAIPIGGWIDDAIAIGIAVRKILEPKTPHVRV